MFRTIILTLITLAIAIIGGALSVNHVLNDIGGFDRLKIGQWEAYPDAGTENADAYARARSAKRGDIALGRAEGLTFQAWTDSEGEPLRAQCSYRLRGALPETRFFTLYAASRSLEPRKTRQLLPSELASRNMLRNNEGHYQIVISSRAHPGNWLATEGQDEYGLVLTLYDTPIAATTGLAKLVMPQIERIKEKPCE